LFEVIENFFTIPKMNIKANLKHKANKALARALPGNYFDGIPIETICETLQSIGILVLQEDGQPWEGVFCGRDGSAILPLGLKIGEIAPNAGLSISWHKMESGKMEVVIYVS
jgi:hypothetical protein